MILGMVVLVATVAGVLLSTTHAVVAVRGWARLVFLSPFLSFAFAVLGFGLSAIGEANLDPDCGGSALKGIFCAEDAVTWPIRLAEAGFDLGLYGLFAGVPLSILLLGVVLVRNRRARPAP